CARAAATTSGCAWPTFATPMPARRSSHARPWSSHTVAPDARATTRPIGPSDVWQTCRRKSADSSSLTIRPSRFELDTRFVLVAEERAQRRTLPPRPIDARALHAADGADAGDAVLPEEVLADLDHSTDADAFDLAAPEPGQRVAVERTDRDRAADQGVVDRARRDSQHDGTAAPFGHRRAGEPRGFYRDATRRARHGRLRHRERD